MAATARVRSVVLQGSEVHVTVVVTDTVTGETVHELVLDAESATPAEIRERVRRRVAVLAAAANIMPGTPIDLTPSLPVVDTPAVVAQKEWLRDYQRLRTVKQLIANGVLTGTETQVTTLQNTVNAGFLPAYVDLI